MRRTSVSALVGLIFPVVAGSAALGDTVTTSDGSRFVGTVEGMSGGKLTMMTTVAGRIEIEAAKIVAIDTDKPMTVEFETGDRLIGTIDIVEDEQASVMRTGLGEVGVSVGKIRAIWPVGAESPEVVAMKAEVEKVRQSLAPKWFATLEAGGSRTEGNTDTLAARGKLDVKRVTQSDLLNLYLAAQYSEQNNKRTTNEYRGGINYEAFLDKQRYWYTRMELEFDEFENLDLRATATTGVGYYWLREANRELKTRIGFGYRHETFNTGRTRDSAVLDLGLGLQVELGEWGRFTHSTTYSPDIEDTGDYRLDLDTALVMPLRNERMKLKLGVRNEYSSRPLSGLDRLDSTYYANIVLDLVN